MCIPLILIAASGIFGDLRAEIVPPSERNWLSAASVLAILSPVAVGAITVWLLHPQPWNTDIAWLARWPGARTWTALPEPAQPIPFLVRVLGDPGGRFARISSGVRPRFVTAPGRPGGFGGVAPHCLPSLMGKIIRIRGKGRYRPRRAAI